MIQSFIKKEALVYMEKKPLNYFREPDGSIMPRRKGIGIASFYNGLNGKAVRPGTAVKILTILGVPTEKIPSFIVFKRVEDKSEKPERRSHEGTVAHQRMH